MKADIQQCQKCGISETYFNTIFYDGLCGACKFENELTDQDYNQRTENLHGMLTHTGGQRKSKYDCLIPIRGDAEDYFILNYIIKLKLNPLVVMVNNYFLNDLAWHNVHNMITHYDVDSIIFNPNINHYKEAIRSSLRKLDSIYYPYKALHYSYVIRLAKEKGIKWVVWGQCQPIEFAGKYSKRDELRLSSWWVAEHELGGKTFDAFLGTGVQLDSKASLPYQYPSKSVASGVSGIFLSNYMKWDQRKQNEDSLLSGFAPDTPRNTFDKYENAGSSVYYQLHDLLRVKKFGVPKLEQQWATEARKDRMPICPDREQLHRYLAYEIDSFFSEFLQVTKSGYEWFVENRLSGVKHLLRTEAEKQFDASNTLPSNKCASEFILFKKGI